MKNYKIGDIVIVTHWGKTYTIIRYYDGLLIHPKAYEILFNMPDFPSDENWDVDRRIKWKIIKIYKAFTESNNAYLLFDGKYGLLVTENGIEKYKITKLWKNNLK
jgi:hypothetical protein